MSDPFSAAVAPPATPLAPTGPPSPPRRRNWPWVVAIGLFVAFVYTVALLGFWFFSRGTRSPDTRITHGTVLEIDLGAPLSEGPPETDFGPFAPPGGSSIWELRQAIAAAASDSDIAGILLRISNPLIGWGSAEELLGYLDRFRESGKPVHALLPGDLVGDLDYFLATGADRIWINPETGIAINGLIAESQFYRGSLEKLHIEPQVIMHKEYKSAGEPFANSQMSEYMREALAAVLATFHDRFFERVTTRRAIDSARLDTFVAAGLATAADLVELGLADELGYADQVEATIATEAGVGDYHGTRLSKYLETLPEASSGRRRIAVVFGEGAVVAEAAQSPFPFLTGSLLSGPLVARNIRDAARDSRVAAILFRVNSPGGSAVGSDLVRREIENARTAGKPVVVSMGDVAGSGGYWVAMDANAIVAQPTTITGSIGVVFQKFNLEGFYEWLGTGVGRVATAPRAGILSAGPWNPGDREAVEGWMDQVYDSFTGSVARARELELQYVLEIARGRIWSGRDALERKLVDRLGGIDDALEIAKELAGLEPERDVPLVVFPRPKTLFQLFFEDGWVNSGPLPTRAAILDWVNRVATPRVAALAPEFRVR